jgi:hypothetical protein
MDRLMMNRTYALSEKHHAEIDNSKPAKPEDWRRECYSQLFLIEPVD